MRELKIKLWNSMKKEMLKPQAITFDIKSLAPFAVKVSGGAWEQVERYELIQWTGLTDIDGADVYEGDIIKISSTLYKVVWNKEAASFELEELENAIKRGITDVASGKIVGNKFEKLRI